MHNVQTRQFITVHACFNLDVYTSQFLINFLSTEMCFLLYTEIEEKWNLKFDLSRRFSDKTPKKLFGEKLTTAFKL